MLEKDDLLSIPFYKKSAYTGSLGNMRYKVERNPEDQDHFTVYTWKGPLAFDTTKEEKETASFPFNDDGIQEICDFLNKKQVAFL